MKKGFTLVELLGVIIVLGLIITIVTPVIGGVITSSREKAYESQINVIETSAKEWGVENVDWLPNPGSTKTIELSTLINSGKLQNTRIINPITKQQMTGCIVVTYNNEYSQYEYNYTEGGLCD